MNSAKPLLMDAVIRGIRKEISRPCTPDDNPTLEVVVGRQTQTPAVMSLEYENLVKYTCVVRTEVLEGRIGHYYLFLGTERKFKQGSMELDAFLLEIDKIRDDVESQLVKGLSHERYDQLFNTIRSLEHDIYTFREHFRIWGPRTASAVPPGEITFTDLWKWFVEFLTSDKPPQKIIATQYERETAAGVPLSIGKYERLIHVINNKRPAIYSGGYNSHFTLEAHCEIDEKIDTLALQITEAERVGNKNDYCSLLKQRDQLENDIRSINAKYDEQKKLEWEKLNKQKSEEKRSKQISPQIAYVAPATAPLPQAQVQGTQVNSQTSTYNPSGDYRDEVMISDRNDKAREKAERKREREEEKWYRQQRRQDYERRKYERNAGKPRHKWT